MVVVDLGLLVAPLDARIEGIRGIGGDFRAEEIQRQGEMEIQLLLDRRQVDHAQGPDRLDIRGILDAGLPHGLAGALDRTSDPGFADEHMMRFFRQHETAGAAQRIEAGLRQAFELHLAVAVGEVGEHEEGQPVRRRLVEGAEHARRLGRAGAALQQAVRLLAPIGPEVLVQEIDHSPEVAPFLDVDLKEIAQVIERGSGGAEMALLFDRSRFGVALNHDKTAQHGAVLAGHLLPGGLAVVRAEGNRSTLDLRRQQDAPTVLRHLDIVEARPALGIDADRRPQVDHPVLETLGPQVLPPVDVAGMPALKRLQHAAVAGQSDVVRNLCVVADFAGSEHLYVSSSWRLRRQTRRLS